MTVPFSPSGGYTTGPVDRLNRSIGVSAGSMRITQSDLGNYFVSTNPTPGSALAYNVQSGYSATVPFAYLYNSASSGGKSVYLDYIKIICTTAPASGTQTYYALLADTIARTINTNNMTAITPVCPNVGSTNTPVLQVSTQTNGTASALAAASSNARLIGRGSISGVPIVGDEVIIDFGADSIEPDCGLTATATVPGRSIAMSPQAILAPGNSLMVALWFPSNASTGLSYEFEMGHWEQ